MVLPSRRKPSMFLLQLVRAMLKLHVIPLMIDRLGKGKLLLLTDLRWQTV